MPHTKKRRALIVVDVQNDFCPGGNLAVDRGDEVVATINLLMGSGKYDLIVATQDWHPRTHKSFATNNPGSKVGSMRTLNGLPQVMWPDHCVQHSMGAAFHPALDAFRFNAVVKKGQDKEVDSYSGFFDNDKKSATGLEQILRDENIVEVDVVGLALDYCVKATALDAQALGFKTRVLVESTRAVNLSISDSDIAVGELEMAGVEVA